MNLLYIIEETALMMGFTFIVGIAFAYVLKLMTFFFSRLGGKEISASMERGRIWLRAYRMDLTRTYRYIWSATRTDDGSLADMAPDEEAQAEAARTQDGLAEYHFGNLLDAGKQDPEMSRLYELHHGKI